LDGGLRRRRGSAPTYSSVEAPRVVTPATQREREREGERERERAVDGENERDINIQAGLS